MTPKPRTIYLESEKSEALKQPDILSVQATVFRNGGTVNGKEAIGFVELTAEVKEALGNLL